jgi:hypothetical protein
MKELKNYCSRGQTQTTGHGFCPENPHLSLFFDETAAAVLRWSANRHERSSAGPWKSMETESA